MNTAGQIGAFLSPIILPYLLKDQSRAEDWATASLHRRRPLPRRGVLLAVRRPGKAARHEA